MDWSQTLTQIQNRLPELEHHIEKFGMHFPLNLLPPGLFRDVTTGMDCITDIAQDLQRITAAKSSDKMLSYWGERLSQKIHVLVHICRNQTQRKDTPGITLERMSTRTQWLAQLEAQQVNLRTQRKSMVATLNTMQARKDKEAIQVLQNKILDIDTQLTKLFEKS